MLTCFTNLPQCPKGQLTESAMQEQNEYSSESRTCTRESTLLMQLAGKAQ